MKSFDWTAIITAIVAIYGAILSTYNLIIRRREDRHQVDVSLRWGLLTNNSENTFFFLSAANPGKRSVTLSGCYIELPNKKQLIMPYTQGEINFPHVLEEGKSCMVWFPVKEVVQALLKEGYNGNVNICAVYRDAVGGEYKS